MVGSTLCLVNLQLERSVSWLRRNWGKRNFGFDSLKSRLKLVSRLRRPWSPQHGCRGMRLPRNRRRGAPPSIYITRCQGTAAGSGQRGSGGRPRQQSRAIIPFSSMWRRKNQRRRRTRRSRLRFIISSGGTHSFWP